MNRQKFIITLILLVISLIIPVLIFLYFPIYSDQNTLEDQGTITSTEVNRHIVGKARTNLVVYVLDNGNRYYIPSGFNSFVDSFDFEQKGTLLTLRYDPHQKRDNAYVIVSVCDAEREYMSVGRTNQHERLTRILACLLYVVCCLLIVGVAWLGDIIKTITEYKRERNHRRNVERKQQKRERFSK